MLMKLEVEDGRLARGLAVQVRMRAPGALASMKQFTVTTMDYKERKGRFNLL
jgi:hypothetical protein